MTIHPIARLVEISPCQLDALRSAPHPVQVLEDEIRRRLPGILGDLTVTPPPAGSTPRVIREAHESLARTIADPAPWEAPEPLARLALELALRATSLGAADVLALCVLRENPERSGGDGLCQLVESAVPVRNVRKMLERLREGGTREVSGIAGRVRDGLVRRLETGEAFQHCDRWNDGLRLAIVLDIARKGHILGACAAGLAVLAAALAGPTAEPQKLYESNGGGAS